MTDLQSRVLRLVAKEEDNKRNGCASAFAIAHLEWTESGGAEAVSLRRIGVIRATLWGLEKRGYVTVADWYPNTIYRWKLTDAGRAALEKEGAADAAN